jgi:hypothetical protein
VNLEGSPRTYVYIYIYIYIYILLPIRINQIQREYIKSYKMINYIKEFSFSLALSRFIEVSLVQQI